MFNFNGIETTFPLFLKELKFMQNWRFILMCRTLLQAWYFSNLRTIKQARFPKTWCTLQAGKWKSGLND